MQPTEYTRPRVRDYGNLVDLTAAPDVSFVGSVGKIAVMAAMSMPIGYGSGRNSAAGALPGTAEGLSHGTDPGSGAGPVLADTGSGGGAGAGAPAGGGGGGKLPFTGYPALILAAVGAGFAMVGASVRLKLRRG